MHLKKMKNKIVKKWIRAYVKKFCIQLRDEKKSFENILWDFTLLTPSRRASNIFLLIFRHHFVRIETFILFNRSSRWLNKVKTFVRKYWCPNSRIFAYLIPHVCIPLVAKGLKHWLFWKRYLSEEYIWDKKNDYYNNWRIIAFFLIFFYLIYGLRSFVNSCLFWWQENEVTGKKFYQLNSYKNLVKGKVRQSTLASKK